MNGVFQIALRARKDIQAAQQALGVRFRRGSGYPPEHILGQPQNFIRVFAGSGHEQLAQNPRDVLGQDAHALPGGSEFVHRAQHAAGVPAEEGVRKIV